MFNVQLLNQNIIIRLLEHKQRTVVRRCQLANINPCNFSRQQLWQNREIDCEICEEDSCNGSSNNQIFGIMLGIATAVSICIHLRL